MRALLAGKHVQVKVPNYEARWFNALPLGRVRSEDVHTIVPQLCCFVQCTGEWAAKPAAPRQRRSSSQAFGHGGGWGDTLYRNRIAPAQFPTRRPLPRMHELSSANRATSFGARPTCLPLMNVFRLSGEMVHRPSSSDSKTAWRLLIVFGSSELKIFLHTALGFRPTVTVPPLLITIASLGAVPWGGGLCTSIHWEMARRPCILARLVVLGTLRGPLSRETLRGP